jgi:hypothetical protein
LDVERFPWGSVGPSTLPDPELYINVQEEKTHLWALLLPLDPSPRRQLGFLQGRLDEAFFEPLPGEELERWGA